MIAPRTTIGLLARLPRLAGDQAPYRSRRGRVGAPDPFGRQPSGSQPCLRRNVPRHQMRQVGYRWIRILSPHENSALALDHQIEGMGVERGAGRCG